MNHAYVLNADAICGRSYVETQLDWLLTQPVPAESRIELPAHQLKHCIGLKWEFSFWLPSHSLLHQHFFWVGGLLFHFISSYQWAVAV